MTALQQLGKNDCSYERAPNIENHITDHLPVVLSVILSQGLFYWVFFFFFTIDSFLEVIIFNYIAAISAPLEWKTDANEQLRIFLTIKKKKVWFKTIRALVQTLICFLFLGFCSRPLMKAERQIRVISFLSHLEKLDVYQKLDTAQKSSKPTPKLNLKQCHQPLCEFRHLAAAWFTSECEFLKEK